MEGNCAVCLVKSGKIVKGDAANVVVHDGLRYLFPGSREKEMFEKDPSAFTPALGGHCTVCKVEMNKPVAGSARYSLVHEGRLYLFPGKEQLDMFKSNPGKYANADLALKGNCVVCKVEMQKDVPGKDEFAIDYQAKRYLFPDEKTRGMFLANPEKYTRQ